jgi:hypothetical protein
MARNLKFAALVLVLSAAAMTLIGCHGRGDVAQQPPQPPQRPPFSPANGNDSPIEVVGGTIHICTANPVTPPASGTTYVASAGDTTKVTFEGVSFPSALPDWTKPWTITLSNLKKDPKLGWVEKPGAVTLSTDSANPTTQVDIALGTDGTWKFDGNKQTIRTLKFHDEAACKGDSEGSRCDHLVNVTVANTGAGAGTPVPGQCLGGACKIIIGTPGDDDCE